jgi:hypothetical protein
MISFQEQKRYMPGTSKCVVKFDLMDCRGDCEGNHEGPDDPDFDDGGGEERSAKATTST